MYVTFSAPFTPAVEIGSQFAQPHWGQGYAIEAARATCDFGFDTLRLSEILAFTVPNNVRSRQVMERLGMTHSPEDDFDSPLFPEGHRCGATCCIDCVALGAAGACSLNSSTSTAPRSGRFCEFDRRSCREDSLDNRPISRRQLGRSGSLQNASECRRRCGAAATPRSRPA